MSTVQWHDGNEIQLLQSGQAFFPALMTAIAGSTLEVRLETYIFQCVDAGERVAEALEAAALRGVQVYLVMDGIGTPELSPQWAQRLTQAGVHWHRFSPLGRLGLLVPGRWRRLHRKLCVIDGQLAFCGGINILDDWHDHVLPEVQEFPRFDFAVQVRGPLVADVRAAMVQFWGRLQATRQLERMEWRGAQQAWRDSQALLGMALPTRPMVVEGGVRAALVLRDNVRHRARIEQAYRKAIAGAREEVFIANAYCIPGGKLRRALVHAARRGVRVRLLLQGQYESFMQFHAARPVLGALLAAGVEIHEYRDRPLHAKVAVVDRQWATVGSSNLDPLSLLLAREANVVLEDAAFARLLHSRLEQAAADHGVPLDAASYAARPLRQRFLDRLAFGIMRGMLFLIGRRY